MMLDDMHGSEKYKELVHCRNGHVIAAPTVDESVRENDSKLCQDMRAVH
jgi:hypothetical protein